MNRNPSLITTLILLLISLLIVACGRRALPEPGGSSGSGSSSAASAPGSETPTATSVAAATPLKAQFKQPTPVPQKDKEDEEEEEAKEEETKAEDTPTPAVDLSRGERTYTNKKCGDCHGSAGEGVEEKGGPLAGTALTEAEFTDILRTGAKGELGNDHLYGTQSISPSGMEALYAFVASLQ